MMGGPMGGPPQFFGQGNWLNGFGLETFTSGSYIPLFIVIILAFVLKGR